MSNVPDFDIIIPTSRNYQVRIISIELNAENSIGMTWLSSSTTFKLNDQTSCLLIVNPDDTIRTSRGELSSIGIVIDSQQLIELIINSMKKLSGGGVPMNWRPLLALDNRGFAELYERDILMVFFFGDEMKGLKSLLLILYF